MSGRGSGDSTSKGRRAMEILGGVLLGAALGGIATWLLVSATVNATHRDWWAFEASAGAPTGVLSLRWATLTLGQPWPPGWSLGSDCHRGLRAVGAPHAQQGDLSADGRGRPQRPGVAGVPVKVR